LAASKKKPLDMINQESVVAHKNLENVLEKSGFKLNAKDEQFKQDLIIIKNLMNTDVGSAINKYQHTYDVLDE
jgi:hypothetical protein